jgi:hypothetical protein
MKYRIAGWAIAGFLIAASWGFYFANADRDNPIRIVDTLARLTCPIAIASLHFHFPVSFNWALVANAATYALAGVAVESLRKQFHRAG